MSSCSTSAVKHKEAQMMHSDYIITHFLHPVSVDYIPSETGLPFLNQEEPKYSQTAIHFPSPIVSSS